MKRAQATSKNFIYRQNAKEQSRKVFLGVLIYFAPLRETLSSPRNNNPPFVGSWMFAEEQELDSTGAGINRVDSFFHNIFKKVPSVRGLASQPEQQN